MIFITLIIYLQVFSNLKCEELETDEAKKVEIEIILNIMKENGNMNSTKNFTEKILYTNRPKTLYRSYYNMFFQVFRDENNTKEEKQFNQNYFLQFNIIPSLTSFHSLNRLKGFIEDDEIDKTFFSNKDIIKSYLNESPLYKVDEINWDEIKIEAKMISNNSFKIIYDFGEPKYDTLCRFAIFYVDLSNFYIFEYITLEKSEIYNKYPYYIGIISRDKHYDFNIECEPDLNTFENFVDEFIKYKIQRNEYYYYEFVYLPKLFEIYEIKIKNHSNEQFDENDFLLNKTKHAEELKFENINWDKCNIYEKELNKDIKEYIYDFGQPIAHPLFRYAIFYVDTKNEIYEFFTLEKKIDISEIPYLIGLQKNNKHIYYDIELEDNFENFEKWVKYIIETSYMNTKETDL